MCTAVREPSGSDRPPPASPVSACGVASGMRQVTASGGSAARGRPLPASATAQRLQACTRRRWLTGSRGYAVHGLGTDSRQAPTMTTPCGRDVRLPRRTIVPARRPGKARPRSLHDSVAGRTAGGMRHVTASVLVGHRMGRLRLPAGCPAGAIPRPTARRRTARGGRRSAIASPRCPRGARLRGRNRASERTPWMPWPEYPDLLPQALPRFCHATIWGISIPWSIRGKRWKGSWGPALDAEFRSGTGRPGNRDRRNSPAGRRRSVAQRRVDPRG